jgi:hypothetical protein
MSEAIQHIHDQFAFLRAIEVACDVEIRIDQEARPVEVYRRDTKELIWSKGQA